MKLAQSLEEIKSFIQDHQLVLFYISQENCSVCHSLLPQVEQVLEDFPTVQSIRVDALDVPEVAGEFNVFTAPVVIVFADGKEMLRKARFVPIGELTSQISRLVEMID